MKKEKRRDMQLIHKETNQALVEFKENEVIFHSRILENEMKFMGIPIPTGLRSHYSGKDCIFLGEDKFAEAFKEIYYLTSMNPKLFFWKN